MEKQTSTEKKIDRIEKKIKKLQQDRKIIDDTLIKLNAKEGIF